MKQRITSIGFLLKGHSSYWRLWFSSNFPGPCFCLCSCHNKMKLSNHTTIPFSFQRHSDLSIQINFTWLSIWHKCGNLHTRPKLERSRVIFRGRKCLHPFNADRIILLSTRMRCHTRGSLPSSSISIPVCVCVVFRYLPWTDSRLFDEMMYWE